MVKEATDMRTELCPHGCGHRNRVGHQHARANCPPPAGKHGDRYHSLSPKKESSINVQLFDQRGSAVKDTGKPSASSDKRAGGKPKIAGKVVK